MGTEPATAERHYARDSVEFSRAIAFFDAVYAFAVTLLVVNLDPPAASDWSSLAALLDSGLEWQLLGFAISFVVIAAFWRVNHRIVAGFRALSSAHDHREPGGDRVHRADPVHDAGDQRHRHRRRPLAMALYAVNISCAMLAQSAMYYVALHDGMVAHPLPRRAAVARLLDILVTPAVFLASIPIAYTYGATAAR